MFDPVSEGVIKSARHLSDLDPTVLAEELTSIHIEIAATRLALESPSTIETDDLTTALQRLGRLADTYEAQIVLNLNLSFTKAMAFVSASARQAIGQAGRVLGNALIRPPVDKDSLGSDLISALLYLIAERSSDAFEAARHITVNDSRKTYAGAIATAVREYAQGKLAGVVQIHSLLSQQDITGADPAELLFRELLQGLAVLANVGLGELQVSEIATAKMHFQLVIDLSVETSVINGLSDSGIIFTSIFGGPRQLAALLLCLADGLSQGAIVLITAPQGANSVIWSNWVKAEATTWPFLWETHREAVASGYLDAGNSLVMTTPTGSGKTTLAALKIAATLAAGKSVLYLAPTHALVSQVEKDLNERVGGIETARSIEDISLDDVIEVLPAISVVTPERCFALLTFAPEIFTNVGLLVFDECHLLGASSNGNQVIKADRRSVDAMLCLLTFIGVNRQADCLLLSAMINNGADVAEWLSVLLGRPVFAYDNKWKPTRQLRSCVVYKHEDIRLLERGLKQKHVRGQSGPAAVPYGIFSLASGWNPGMPDKLVLKSLSQNPVPLAIGGKANRRYLTANRNEVAAAIALRLASKGMKVIVFCASIDSCSSIAKAINDRMPILAVSYSSDQAKWRNDIIAEAGEVTAIYDSGGLCAAVHHGELLPDERKLVESLFKDRESGVNVLAATSTLSQGLNLPCEAVVIAGTDRLDESDPEEKKRVSLLPHEILNAVGRAGRAGQAATGLSIIVPGNPITCSFGSMDISHDHDLSIIFAPNDQCLPLTDPLTTLFDEIEVSNAFGPEAQYLLRRLAVSLRSSGDTENSFESLARQTFGFYQKAKQNALLSEVWISNRKEALIGALTSVEMTTGDVAWVDELAAKTGASSAFIAKLVDNYSDAPRGSASAEVWYSWLLDLLDHNDDSFDIFIRPETMVRVFGRAITSIKDVALQRQLSRESVRYIIKLWFAGKTLTEIEEQIAIWIAALEVDVKRATSPHKKIKRARRFVLRVAPDLAFLSGVLLQIGKKIATDKGELPPMMLRYLGQLVRKGLPTPYHYALAANNATSSRVRVHGDFLGMSDYIEINAYDDWAAIAEKIRIGAALAAFRDAAI